VGLGYLPKGGRAAGAAHNAAVESAPRSAASAPAPGSLPADARTDVRAQRVRSAALRSDRIVTAAVAVVVSLATTGLLDWLVR
jgi:hypothetical protein